MSDSLDYIDAIRLKALRAVLDPDASAWFRSVMRWYSREFSTPLKEVADLDIEEVLVAYFEEQYSSLKDGDEHGQETLDRILQELIETQDERQTRKLKEKADEEQARELLKIAEEAARQAKEKGNILENKKQHKPEELKAVAQPQATPHPPDIEIKFNDNLLDEAGDLDPISAPPPGTKRNG